VNAIQHCYHGLSIIVIGLYVCNVRELVLWLGLIHVNSRVSGCEGMRL